MNKTDILIQIPLKLMGVSIYGLGPDTYCKLILMPRNFNYMIQYASQQTWRALNLIIWKHGSILFDQHLNFASYKRNIMVVLVVNAEY